MPAKQTPLLLGRLVAHQRFFNPLSTAAAQWAIMKPKEAVALFVAAIMNRTKDSPKIERTFKVLRPVTPIPIASEPFSANNTFFNMKSSVKMVDHGSNFKSWFTGKVEDDAPSGMLVPFTLTESAYDHEIIADLGGEDKVEVTLTEVWRLMCVQANGEKGALLTNGYANIFYVRDVSGVLCAVFVYWYDFGWFVDALVLDAFRWSVDSQAFPHNS